ncbi:MAG TPA: sigma-70 family RNA polymerase sigma factor [Planctomycetota bacterium]|nr:sigma-70 family RNA polymerase sigma factor [Planctomycetota bacterium]
MTDLRRDFETQLRRYMDALYYAALDLSGNSSDADDIVQEAALKGLRRFDTFQAGTDFKAWMMTIVANTYIDLYRRRRREKPATSEEARQALEEPESALRAGDLEFLLPDDVERALASLPDAQRAAIVLVDVNGLTNQEAAEALGWPLGTVNSRVYRGRAELRTILRRAADGHRLLGKGTS